MKNLVPLILGFTLIALSCILSYLRFQSSVLNIWKNFPLNFDLIFVILYLLWIFFESTVSKKELKKGSNISDYGTLELYALGQGLTFLSALWFKPLWSSPGVYHVIGGLIFCIGVLFRIWAVQTLGDYYSHVVREVKEHKIVDTGPYKYIRHPAYSGMIIANIGVTVFFLNWYTILFCTFLLIPAIILRIIIEEKTLFQIQGYIEFAKQKKRIIPKIW